jgi:hypothetical protein
LVISGEFTFIYPDGKLYCKGSVKKGLRVGEWVYWNKNGILDKIETYYNGKIYINDKTRRLKKMNLNKTMKRRTKNKVDAIEREEDKKE